MKILTDAEYERRLEKAREEGWNKRCDLNNQDEFRDSIWRAIRESRQDLDRQIMALREALHKAGIEDPTEPQKTCSFGTADCTPVYR